MDNEGTDNTFSIQTKKHYTQEMIALHGKIEKLISGVSSKVQAQHHAPSKSTGVKSGILVNHEFQVREAIGKVEAMDEEAWIEHKEELQNIFKDANEALNSALL